MGKNATVAISIPIGPYDGVFKNQSNDPSPLRSPNEDYNDNERKYDKYDKYDSYDKYNERDITMKKRGGTMTSNSNSDNISDTSSASSEPNVNDSGSDYDQPSTSTSREEREATNHMIQLNNNDIMTSSAVDSFINSNSNGNTLNAEDPNDWNDNNTLDFDVNPNSDADIYSESLLATDESEPPNAYYPQSIKPKRASTNRGTVNRFNIGIAGSDRVSFTDYAPHVFRYLRTKIYKVSDKSYLQSILPPKVGGEITRVSEEIKQTFSEGRSGAFFFFTPDNRYIIKTLTKEEAQLLIDTLGHYVEYMKKHGEHTFLTKYFGLHSVKLYSKVIYFMVSGNVFPADKGLAEKIKERYDIKGSWIDRHTNRHLFENKLMKDEDLHRNLQLDPITSNTIHTQLKKDTAFLQKQNIMDYSLLLGISYQQIDNKYNIRRGGGSSSNKRAYFIDENAEQEYNNKLSLDEPTDNYTVKANIVEGPGTYYIGIIDMLQKWNTNKKLERAIKVYLRCKNKAGISCVEPVFYRKRFLKKMQKIGL